MTPDVMFNILNDEFSSLAWSFATRLKAGLAEVEDPRNLFAESYKIASRLVRSALSRPRSVLVRKWVQDFIEKMHDKHWMQSKTSLVALLWAPVENPPTERIPLSERPAERAPLMDC
ncbi:hypothetical protein TNCV_1805471 [Trichonephila clavipes]|nr:hypothetical protein TNCV_1805471 [Trichonephila clavipes]